MNTNDAKEYLSRREIPQLFESLLTGLMYYRPDDPLDYLETCLKKVKELGGTDKVRWDTFVGQEKKSLPPLNGGQSRRSFFRNVLPDSPNFPYRRYERLPPINQFSIESDSDLSETAELIEEYEVFDPSRPRPKVILIIADSKDFIRHVNHSADCLHNATTNTKPYLYSNTEITSHL
ncbi:Adenylate kinase isoenzyme 5 [Anabarilius grahami]|uniref:Adenylate kinase isoenzyme 5 n=1 Tax=Anabarilius grahami TaxID=495550 RepID=A0A3N0Y0J1_ANAGA|nr:Adenylate kinase isoenzyme 5 [Anabarilius grahami]